MIQAKVKDINVINDLYQEAKDLLDAMRQYITDDQKDFLADKDPLFSLKINCENTRVTTRLLHVVAWMLLQKSILEGESVDIKATEDMYIFPIDDSYLNNDTSKDEAIPQRLRELLDQSYTLYTKVLCLNCEVNHSNFIAHSATLH